MSASGVTSPSSFTSKMSVKVWRLSRRTSLNASIACSPSALRSTRKSTRRKRSRLEQAVDQADAASASCPVPVAIATRQLALAALDRRSRPPGWRRAGSRAGQVVGRLDSRARRLRLVDVLRRAAPARPSGVYQPSSGARVVRLRGARRGTRCRSSSRAARGRAGRWSRRGTGTLVLVPRARRRAARRPGARSPAVALRLLDGRRPRPCALRLASTTPTACRPTKST